MKWAPRFPPYIGEPGDRAVFPTPWGLAGGSARHDVIVAHHFTFPAPIVAELTGFPWATVSLAPGVVPSAYSLPAPILAAPGADFSVAVGTGSSGRRGK